VIYYTILLLKIGAAWWESFNYFGDGILYAELNVHNINVARGSSGQFLKLFGPADGDFGIRSETIILADQPRPEATASVGVNFASMRQDVPRTVTSVMNMLLRSLGHSVLLAEFEDNIRTIL
jgi:hypothetical protein